MTPVKSPTCQTLMDGPCIRCGVKPHTDKTSIGAHEARPLRCWHSEAAHRGGRCIICGGTGYNDA